ncbi:fused response regulator/phosphatase [Gammaproteobacteria bacterium 45_16_T64]|nr:fused response regulator/phosphatase [Gammaproteobacteria bacterium 45_16_T64]
MCVVESTLENNLPAPAEENLRILIADDNDSDRLILQTIVRKEGHTVYTARDGQEAIDAFVDKSPDLILLDALMPNVDGFQAARAIRDLAGENLVPIIFLTSLKDAASLADCLDAGGHDFLSKPYNRIILKAKILAFARMRKLHETVQAQRDEIVKHHDHLIHEQEVAKVVFDNIAHSGCVDAPNIKHLLSPMAVFNGDLILAARKPNGGMFVFLGDFTGHGLPAAIGAMPVSEIFYGMAQKGFSLQDIMREINNKLKRILPVGVFCCSCLVDFSFRNETAEFWLGGLPDVFVYRQDDSIENFASQHLPLGVLGGDKFSTDTRVIPMNKGDRFYMWSDGILEEVNNRDEMFGEDGVRRAFAENKNPDNFFEELIASVAEYTNHADQDDDHTIVEAIMVAEEDLGEYFSEQDSRSLIGGPPDWSMSYELRPLTLREFNPLPLLTHLLMEVPGLRPHSGKIYTILAELYSNALEHGVLGLDSELKASPTGFAEYYGQRVSRLESLDKGKVIFHLDHEPMENGGRLTLRVQDSGLGFEHADKDEEHKTAGYCGRGIPLINTMCESVRYLGNGNQVEVVFVWTFDG